MTVNQASVASVASVVQATIRFRGQRQAPKAFVGMLIADLVYTLAYLIRRRISSQGAMRWKLVIISE